MKNQKGITLIALIITIIVMMILVGVSVTVALNSGLFKVAQGAAKNTVDARENELLLAEGIINVNGEDIDIKDYINSLQGGEKITFTLDGEQREVAKGTTWETYFSNQILEDDGCDLANCNYYEVEYEYLGVDASFDGAIYFNRRFQCECGNISNGNFVYLFKGNDAVTELDAEIEAGATYSWEWV